MRRDTRVTAKILADEVVDSVILGGNYAVLNTHEAQKLVRKENAWVIESYALPDGRKVQKYLKGAKPYAWVAGLHDGTKEDDFPLPPDTERSEAE
jgi:hypothetical protein